MVHADYKANAIVIAIEERANLWRWLRLITDELTNNRYGKRKRKKWEASENGVRNTKI
ncbi:MAG: hypothetical protein R2788_04420 [Saprospiraceae bacterium]